MICDTGSHWYVVQTRINSESKAAARLRHQGFDVYLPRYQKTRSHARKVSVVARPLFPRYLFVAVESAVHWWRAIQSTTSVSHLICGSDLPASVGNEVIHSIKLREDEKGFIQLKPPDMFAPGDTVRIVEGAFADSLGLVEGIDDRARVTLLLDLLGRKVRVLIGPDLIEAA